MSPFLQSWIQKTKKPKTWKVDIFYSLYSIVIQVFIPPHITIIAYHAGEVMHIQPACQINACQNKTNRYGNTGHRPCRTSKYIFWLGKNKFDKQMAPCIIEGMEAVRYSNINYQ